MEEKNLDEKIKLAILESENNLKAWVEKRFAIKLVEGIVFGMVGLILVAVVGAWIALVVVPH